MHHIPTAPHSGCTCILSDCAARSHAGCTARTRLPGTVLAQHAVDTLKNISRARSRARTNNRGSASTDHQHQHQHQHHQQQHNHTAASTSAGDNLVDAGRGAGGGYAANTPFFLGVGFHRPHLPFVVPAALLEMYPLDEIAAPAHQTPPKGMPAVAWSNWISMELRSYGDTAYLANHSAREAGGWGGYSMGLPGATLPEYQQRNMRRAYYAAVTHTDGNVGTVLDALDSTGLRANTVVCFFTDHGWSLGVITAHARACHTRTHAHHPTTTQCARIFRGEGPAEEVRRGVDGAKGGVGWWAKGWTKRCAVSVRRHERAWIEGQLTDPAVRLESVLLLSPRHADVSATPALMDRCARNRNTVNGRSIPTLNWTSMHPGS